MNRSGAAATYRQLHWRNSSNIVLVGELLLLVLAAMNIASAETAASSTEPVMLAVVAYCAWLICSEWALIAGRMNLAIIVIRTWMMAFFVVWIMWSTDGLSSPLRNGVLLAILASSLAVGKINSLLLILLLIVNTLALVHESADAVTGGALIAGETITRITPLAILGCLVALFGPDLRYRLSAWHLARSRCPVSGLLDANGLAIELARLHGELLQCKAPLCALILTVDEGKGKTQRTLQTDHVRKSLALLSSNIFLELRRGDAAALHGTHSIVVLLSHAVHQDCIDLERKLRDVIDIDAIRMEAGAAELNVRYTRVFRERAPHGIDPLLSAFEAGNVLQAL